MRNRKFSVIMRSACSRSRFHVKRAWYVAQVHRMVSSTMATVDGSSWVSYYRICVVLLTP